MDFKKELESLINKHSKENGSNTPDFILAEYLNNCLENFNHIITAREKWYAPNHKYEKLPEDGILEIDDFITK